MATTQCIEKWNTDDADQADKLKYKELIFPGVTVNRQMTDLGGIHSDSETGKNAARTVCMSVLQGPQRENLFFKKL